MRRFLKISLFLVIGLTLSSCSKDKEKEPQEGIVVNGVRWASNNVDAPGVFTANSEDAGMFYQWNRNVGWSSADPLVNSDGETNWNNNAPSGDVWEQENDPCPCGWRVPTMEELKSLEKSKSYYGELNGVSGRFFGDGDNPLFLPVAGNRNEIAGALQSAGAGYYWGSTLKNATASRLAFNSTIVNTAYDRQIFGFNVRCVAE
jgi:uncharacterized protein (TIGR02145 family)